MSEKAPISVQDMSSVPATSGDLSSVINTRNTQPRRLAFGGSAVLAVATAFSSFAGDRPVRAQGDESPAPSPIVSMEPGASFDPNGETAQGEVPCETGSEEVVPAALEEPVASPVVPVSSTTPEVSPVLSAPIGGDIVGGDPSGVDCEPVQESTVLEVFESILSQDEGTIKNVKPGKIEKAIEALWDAEAHPELEDFYYSDSATDLVTFEDLDSSMEYAFDKNSDYRLSEASRIIAMLMAGYAHAEEKAIDGEIAEEDLEENVEFRNGLKKAADQMFDYSVANYTFTPGQRKAVLRDIREYSTNFLTPYLSRLGISQE